jgi:hypothetical protein
MFQRLIWESWQLVLPVIAFALFFAVFLGATLHVMLMKKASVRKLAELPLESEERRVPHDDISGAE